MLILAQLLASTPRRLIVPVLSLSWSIFVHVYALTGINKNNSISVVVASFFLARKISLIHCTLCNSVLNLNSRPLATRASSQRTSGAKFGILDHVAL